MIVELKNHSCIITREPTDPKYPNTVAGESRLLFRIKQELIKQGYDVIKKRMWEDGHMVDELQQYIRTRRPPLENQNDPNRFMLWDTLSVLRPLTQDFNSGLLILNKMN